MGGGLMQLVAYGAQDIYLTGNPQITFFKVVYRRHTNFSMESIEQTWNGDPLCGRATATISRNGDLVHKLYLQQTLSVRYTKEALEQSISDIIGERCDISNPNMKNGGSFVFNPAHTGINNIEVEIGGQMIDRQSGKWMEVISQLTEPNSAGILGIVGPNTGTRFQNMARGGGVVVTGLGSVVDKIGSGDSLAFETFLDEFDTDPTSIIEQLFKYNGETEAITKFDAYVPLRFWFCNNAGLALPLIALQYHEVRVILSMKEQAVNESSLCFGSNIKYECNRLFADYIYLDTDERRRFAQVSHEYLIEQVQYQQFLNTGGDLNLNFNHPVKEIIWTGGQNDRTGLFGRLPGSSTDFLENDYYRKDCAPGANTKYHLELNGHQRMSARPLEYYTKQQVYDYHTGTPVGSGDSYFLNGECGLAYNGSNSGSGGGTTEGVGVFLRLNLNHLMNLQNGTTLTNDNKDITKLSYIVDGPDPSASSVLCNGSTVYYKVKTFDQVKLESVTLFGDQTAGTCKRVYEQRESDRFFLDEYGPIYSSSKISDMNASVGDTINISETHYINGGCCNISFESHPINVNDSVLKSYYSEFSQSSWLTYKPTTYNENVTTGAGTAYDSFRSARWPAQLKEGDSDIPILDGNGYTSVSNQFYQYKTETTEMVNSGDINDSLYSCYNCSESGSMSSNVWWVDTPLFPNNNRTAHNLKSGTDKIVPKNNYNNYYPLKEGDKSKFEYEAYTEEQIENGSGNKGLYISTLLPLKDDYWCKSSLSVSKAISCSDILPGVNQLEPIILWECYDSSGSNTDKINPETTNASCNIGFWNFEDQSTYFKSGYRLTNKACARIATHFVSMVEMELISIANKAFENKLWLADDRFFEFTNASNQYGQVGITKDTWHEVLDTDNYPSLNSLKICNCSSGSGLGALAERLGITRINSSGNSGGSPQYVTLTDLNSDPQWVGSNIVDEKWDDIKGSECKVSWGKFIDIPEKYSYFGWPVFEGVSGTSFTENCSETHPYPIYKNGAKYSLYQDMVSKLKEVCLENKEPTDDVTASGYPCPKDDDFKNNFDDVDDFNNMIKTKDMTLNSYPETNPVNGLGRLLRPEAISTQLPTSGGDTVYKTIIHNATVGQGSTDAIAVYSFSLRPEEHQPSGTCNFSRIDNARLVIEGSPNIQVGGKIDCCCDQYDVYAINYNVLRIMSGMGGLAYSN